jgi:two-component system, NtrC family, response regulator HydG
LKKQDLSLRILVVDDEPAIREVVSELLRDLGHTCLTARDGEEALRLLAHEPFQLVLSDIHMPRLDGMQLLDRVIADYPGVRVMLFTGYGSIANAVDAMKHGAIGYITKPVDFKALGQEIEQLAIDICMTGSGGDLLHEMVKRFEQGLPTSRNTHMNNLMQLSVNRIADSDSSILICGESGTGKELMAALMHHYSGRRNEPFVKINASAIPENLLESELFGHVQGAFTGAESDRKGKIAEADGGTLFLDEIAEMNPAMQAKLLRVLQEREFQPLGSNGTKKVDLRLITATNRDLNVEMKAGRFRSDLYYRLNVLEVQLPPLRERLEDLPELVQFILARLAPRLNREIPSVDVAFVDYLKTLDWPGNIRELENLLERCLLLNSGTTLNLASVPPDYLPGGRRVETKGHGQLPRSLADLTLEEARDHVEREILKQVMEEEQGNVSACARRLGIARKNLQVKIRKYGLVAQQFRKTEQSEKAGSK